jgi:amino acid adenylation domain-containing protein
VISIDALMSRLRTLNVKLWVDGEQLGLRAPKGVMTQELAGQLSARKPEILRYLKQADAAAATGAAGIGPAPRGGSLPLSFGQRRLWFLDRLEGPSPTYNMPLAVRLDGHLDIDALRRALAEIVRRHEVLRANFAIENEQPVVRIREADGCPLTVMAPDAADTGAGPVEAVRRWVERESQHRFDLATDPLLRASLLRVGETSHVFLATIHHIVFDGWSMGVFIRELAALYAAFLPLDTPGDRPPPLPPLPVQYSDYAHWQRQRLQGETLAGLLAYWRGRLAGVPEVLNLPTARPRPPVQTYRGQSLVRPLPAVLAEDLRRLGQAAGTTLFMTLLAGFAALLSRYSGQHDIVVGSVVANRNHPDIEALIGLFINTLALRIDLSGDPTVLELLERVRWTCLDAYQHQDLPFEQLVEELKPPRSLSHSPLFQVSFDLQNTPMERVDMAGLTLSPVEQDAVAAKFDLSLSLEETGPALSAAWTYNPDLFDAATIQRMAGHYQTLLAGMFAGKEARLSELPLLDAEERQQILYGGNATAGDYPRTQNFPDLFGAYADTVPDRIALSFGDEHLSYRRLRQRAERLAAALAALGVGPEALVALCVERSADLMVGLLGILKAGGAYVPLDPAYPRERLAAVLDDARPLVVLTQQRLRANLPETAARVLCLDGEWEATGAMPAPRIRPAKPCHAAYVIYTSGSTGRPKGVQISHQALLNFLWSMRSEPGLSERDVLLAVTTVSFDIAALELYLPLITGARLVLADRDTAMDGQRLQAVMRDHGATCMQATPATWRLLLATGWQPTATQRGLPFTALCGGEALPTDLARQLLDLGVRLWNLYGPTETTVWSAVREVEVRKNGVADAAGNSVEPIGHPIANTQVHILDKRLQPQPVGVPGELYIGGDGLARGYLRRPGLTAAAYLPDPYAQIPGARLYRTGDMARRLAEGTLDFLGRIDHQVKLRGYRIELGEIEAALRRQPGLREAVVLAREDTPGDKRLVAYLLASMGAPPPAADTLRAGLRDSLPAFMIPAAFVFLDALPLTPNGKVDRLRLPVPEPARARPGAAPQASQDAAPRSELENTIAEVWRQVLRLDAAGMDDNFFDLGGHSLLAAQAYEALRQRVAVPFPLLALFQHPTIRSLAARLAGDETPAPFKARALPVAGADGAVAVIGLAGRFPGADDLDAFWANLRDGRESIRFFSDAELLAAGLEPELIARPNYVRANGALSDVAGFDAAFFGITPSEAEWMDPQHRLFLECAWHTLEHAGHGDVRGKSVGVFAGCSYNGYLIRNLIPRLYASDAQSIYQAILLSDKDFLPLRVSYALDLKGPSISVQTACSTSLVAIHQACRSLLAGECEMALAGGVGLKIPQQSGYLYEEGMINSPDGHCRAFDAGAKGTVWGSGVGALLLKPLAAALADRDTIHAVIKGSAVNNDGALKVGFTAPGVEGQTEAVAAAQARAGVDAESISYVEAHGTGTALGDPIEVAALTRAFRAGTGKSGFCALGSVKTNIGHLDTASGVSGLIKTILALQHRQIPPTLHFQSPNPEIDFEHSPFFVNDRLRDWPVGATPRRAGVSSFGIGGTNAHVILEEAPLRKPAGERHQAWRLLVLSARSPSALAHMQAELATHLENHPGLDLSDAAYTLAIGRRHFEHRAAVACRSLEDAVAALRAPPPEASKDRVRLGQASKSAGRAVAFLFPGQGAQQVSMGAGLYRAEAVFREHIDYCAERLRGDLGLDLRDVLYPSAEQKTEAAARLEQTWLTQPALFVTEYAMARQWMAWGVRPSAMIGHSLGEYVAACLAGVFDLDTALGLVARRGRLIFEQPSGAMLAVPLAAAELRARLEDAPSLSLAAVNAPESCVVSGPFPAVDALAARLEADGIACRRLRTSHAFHSAMMEPAAAAFAEVLGTVELKAPGLPFVSNLTGTWIRAEEATDPGYWARHLRQTVEFDVGIGTLLADPERVLLEVGPGTTLSDLARRHPSAGGRTVLASLGRAAPPDASGGAAEAQNRLDALGRLWTLGADIDWPAVYACESLYRIPLPGYAFERGHYWIAATAPETQPFPTLRPARQALDQWFYLPAWKPTPPPHRRCRGFRRTGSLAGVPRRLRTLPADARPAGTGRGGHRRRVERRALSKGRLRLFVAARRARRLRGPVPRVRRPPVPHHPAFLEPRLRWRAVVPRSLPAGPGKRLLQPAVPGPRPGRAGRAGRRNPRGHHPRAARCGRAARRGHPPGAGHAARPFVGTAPGSAAHCLPLPGSRAGRGKRRGPRHGGPAAGGTGGWNA